MHHEGLLLGEKFGFMPSFMRLILLMGVVVNNGILSIDFTKIRLKKGIDINTALLELVENRTCPILMTALSSVVCMIISQRNGRRH